MNTLKNALSTPSNGRIVRGSNNEYLSLGRQHGWVFAALGHAPLPSQPVRAGRWLLIPGQEDTTPLPGRTLNRIQAIYTAGLRPKGFVVVHEAPALLPAQIGEREAEVEISFYPLQWKRSFNLAVTVIGAGLIGIVALPVVLAMVVTAVAMVALPLVLMAGAVGLDPILVAVTEDDCWIEIDRWWTE